MPTPSASDEGKNLVQPAAPFRRNPRPSVTKRDTGYVANPEIQGVSVRHASCLYTQP